MTNLHDEKFRKMVATAFGFKSNSDDFGIFLQGLLAGFVTVFGRDLKEVKVMDEIKEAGVPGIAEPLLRLYSVFLVSKRNTEIERINSLDPRESLRALVIKDIARMSESKRKGESE